MSASKSSKKKREASSAKGSPKTSPKKKTRKKKRKKPPPPLPVPKTGASQAVGKPSYGSLYGAAMLPIKGEVLGIMPSHRKRRRNYATPALAGLLSRVSETMGARHPGLRVWLGDLSAKKGGRISGHASHQNGLDADLALFYRDALEEPASPGYVVLDETGLSKDGKYRLDAALVWELVEELLRDEQADVQYIFLYDPLIQLVLEAGRQRGASEELLSRADAVLAQPGGSSPHAEHMHVRIYCPRDDPEKLCQTMGPVWDWVKHRIPPPPVEKEEESPAELAVKLGDPLRGAEEEAASLLEGEDPYQQAKKAGGPEGSRLLPPARKEQDKE